jgi:hypothetical protein
MSALDSTNNATGLFTVLSHLNQVGCFRLANQQLASGSVVQVAVSGS